MTPRTEAGKRLLAMHATCAPMTACTMHGDLPAAIVAIERDAARLDRAVANDMRADLLALSDDVRARHVYVPMGKCQWCERAWPCPDILAVEKWGVK